MVPDVIETLPVRHTCSFILRENSTRKQAACKVNFLVMVRAEVSDTGRNSCRDSDVWYSASTIHAMVSSPEAAVWLLWNNPEDLSPTLVLLDIL